MARVVAADTVQEEVHHAEPRRVVHDLPAMQRLVLEETLLVRVQLDVCGDVVVRRQEEATGAASRVAEALVRSWAHHLHDRLYQRTGRKVLAGTALGVLGVLLEQPLVGVAFDVGVERRPGLLVDEVDDQPAQLGGVLDLVLRLAEDDAQHPRLLAQRLQGVPVVRLQLVAVPPEERWPVEAGGDARRLAVGWPGALVGHLEEEQVGELLQVVAVGHAVVAQEVAVVPEATDDGLSGRAHTSPA